MRSPRPRPARRHALVIAAATVAALTLAAAAQAQNSRQDRRQERPAKERVTVPVDKIQVDDGDTVEILWGPGDREIVRILGIDTPETQHVEHNIPFEQAFGREAAGFAQGAFAAATQVELMRASETDPYGRTLGYLFINGRNYSEMVLQARLAVESVSRYGDNGFPEEAQKMIEAARAAGPAPFENPGDYRRRMREVSDWMKANGRR